MLSRLSLASAVILCAGGVALLFGSDLFIPYLAPGTPPSAAWMGQLIAAAWIGVGLHNWMTRSAILGGIYGRPTVMLNLVLALVSALGLLKAPHAPIALRVVGAVFAILALAYGTLMWRGPFTLVTKSEP